MRESKNGGDNVSDRQYVQIQMKAIKRAKQRGDEIRAQRLADDLYTFLGWE
jgi:hypothetical protein